MQGPIKNVDGTWLALLALGGACVAGSIAGGAATGRVTDARLRGSFSDVNVPVRLGYDTLNVFQRWWWGQNDPLYAVLSRRGNSTDWVMVDATPAEIERLVEVSHQILSDQHSEAGEKRTAHATLARLTEGMGQSNGVMGPGAVGLGSRSTKRVKRVETAIAKGAIGKLGEDELISVQAALQSAGSLAKRKTLYAKGDRVYNASREVGGVVVDVLGRVGSSEYGSLPEPAVLVEGIEVPFGTRLYGVLYDGLTYSHGPVPETDLVLEAQGSAAFDLDAAIARATGHTHMLRRERERQRERKRAGRQSKQQKKGGEARYGMRLRPPGLGAVPKGFSSFGPHSDFRHGEIVYPQPLSEQQARHFSLTRIPAPQDLTALASQIVRQMQYPTETLEMVKQDGPRGFAWFASTVGSEIHKRNIHVKDRDAFARRVLAQLRAQHS